MIIEEVKSSIGVSGRKTNVRDEIAKEKKEWLKEWQPILDSDENPMNPYRIINEINKNIDLKCNLYVERVVKRCVFFLCSQKNISKKE